MINIEFSEKDSHDMINKKIETRLGDFFWAGMLDCPHFHICSKNIFKLVNSVVFLYFKSIKILLNI